MLASAISVLNICYCRSRLSTSKRTTAGAVRAPAYADLLPRGLDSLNSEVGYGECHYDISNNGKNRIARTVRTMAAVPATMLSGTNSIPRKRSSYMACLL